MIPKPLDEDPTLEELKAKLKATRLCCCGETPDDGVPIKPADTVTIDGREIDLNDSDELTPEKVKAALRATTHALETHASDSKKIAESGQFKIYPKAGKIPPNGGAHA